MKRSRSRFACLAALVSLTAPLPIVAQLVGPPSASAPDETVVLSPFTVSSERDTGYRAASTLAGGRIETPLDQTPAAVSVITREFLDDIGANNFTDAAQWSVNTFLVAPTSDFSDYRVDFRSTGQAGNGTVNYFIFSETMDSYSTERLEFSRGPNSILFGEGNLAGIWTVYLKQPRFRDFGQVQAKVDSRSNTRFSLDLNRTLLDGKAAIRLGLLQQDGRYFRRPSRNDRWGTFLSGAVKLGEDAAFRFEAEYGQRTRTWGDQPITDNVSAWTGTPYTGTGSTAVPANAGLQAITPTVDYLVFLPQQPELGALNLRGFARTVGNSTLALVPGGRPFVPNSDQLPRRDFDVQPDNNLSKGKYFFGTAYLEKRFGDRLFVQLAYNQRYRDYSREGAVWVSDLRRDPNQFLPGGAANPNFGKLYADGDPFVQRQWQDPSDVRLLANYRFETSWTRQNLSLLASHYRNRFHLTNTRLVRTNNPAQATLINNHNVVRQRFYLDEDTGGFAWDPTDFSGSGINVMRYRQLYSTTASDTAAVQLAEVGTYFDDKLTSILGVRRDRVERFNIGSSLNATNAQLTRTRTDLPKTVVTTPTAGLVWYPLPHVGPFVNYSESFSPPGATEALIGTDRSPEPPLGHSWEYGFYFKLLDERITGSLRYYDSVQENRIVNAPGVNSINAIWNTIGQPLQVLPGAPRDTQNLDSTGYELELIANLTPSWRTSFNLALPKSKQTQSYPYTIAYRAQHLAQWQAAAGTYPTVNDLLANLQTAIDGGFDGREQNSALEYTANLYSSYDFRHGRLRGFGFGAGANLYGDQIIGNKVGQPFEYIHNEGFVTVSGHLNYKSRWRHLGYRIQLNVYNLFDKDKLIYGSVGAYQGVNYPNTYRFLDPRRIDLSTTIDF